MMQGGSELNTGRRIRATRPWPLWGRIILTVATVAIAYLVQIPLEDQVAREASFFSPWCDLDDTGLVASSPQYWCRLRRRPRALALNADTISGKETQRLGENKIASC